MEIATTTIRPLGHLPALDGLRAVAILAVMIAHANHVVLQGGGLGVDIFFCLSGFLIKSLLLQEWEGRGTIDFRRFYFRRCLRLFPALLTLLACAVIYACFGLSPEARRALFITVASSLFYVTKWGQAFGWLDSGGYRLGHTWTLSIEEQFYLLWPLILLCLLRLRARPWWIIAILAAAIGAVALERAALWHDGLGYERIYRGLDTRADSLLAGAAAGMIGTWQLLNPTARPVRVMLGVGAVASVVFVTVSLLAIRRPLAQRQAFFGRDGGYSLIAFAVSCILLSLRLFPGTLLDRLLQLQPLVWIGRISYGLYLWHWFLYCVIEDHLPHGGWKVIVGAKVGLSFAAAVLSYRFIEMPFLKWKDRLTPHQSALPTTALATTMD